MPDGIAYKLDQDGIKRYVMVAKVLENLAECNAASFEGSSIVDQALDLTFADLKRISHFLHSIEIVVVI